MRRKNVRRSILRYGIRTTGPCNAGSAVYAMCCVILTYGRYEHDTFMTDAPLYELGKSTLHAISEMWCHFDI